MPDGMMSTLNTATSSQSQPTSLRDKRCQRRKTVTTHGIADSVLWARLDDIRERADRIDETMNGALTAFDIAFGILEDASEAVNGLDNPEKKWMTCYLPRYVDRLYYLLGDIEKRTKAALDSDSEIFKILMPLRQASGGAYPNATLPDDLENLIVGAVSPILVKDDVAEFELAPGFKEIHVYQRLLDICPSFTVADAVRASDVLHTARDQVSCEDDPIRYGALWQACGVFEHFIAAARPSSPDCVGELARHLAIFEEDGEQRMFEVLRPLAAVTLHHGFEAMRTNDFSKGEKFSSGNDGTHGWCKRAIKAGGRQDWWYPSSKSSD